MRSSGAWRAREERAGWLFVAPALVLIAVFFVVPVTAGFLLSVTDFDLYAIGSPSAARFVGLHNFLALARSAEFWRALGNTFYYVLAGVPATLVVSLAAALLLNSPRLRLRPLFRTLYFMPVVTTLVAVAVVWRYLYHPTYGLANHLLAKVGAGPLDWLGDPRTAMPAIILVAVWKNFGYNMLIFVAGLQAIPGALYEAAALDGAGRWRRFLHVTVPQLGPVFLFVGVTTMVAHFQLFAEPYVMTQGGPLGSTRSLVLLMYEEGFRWWRMGIAASLALVLFLITLGGTLLQLRLQAARS